jgi:putative isomerase
MKRNPIHLFSLALLLACVAPAAAQTSPDWQKYVPLIKQTLSKDYKLMFREKGGAMQYPFIVPGSAAYNDVLWDWDSWLTDIALRQIVQETGSEKDRAEMVSYEQGCILNFLSAGTGDGWLPICMGRAPVARPKDIYAENMHKPCLAQHAAFLVKLNNGNAEWLREKFYPLQSFIHKYRSFHRNAITGLYYWQNDLAIGVDNDPSTYYRPPRSSGSIYLNCLMYKELKAMVYLAHCLNQDEIGKEFEREAEKLKAAIQEHCWDERDGFYYSVDFNLLPVTSQAQDHGAFGKFVLHAGYPRDYECLIQRLGGWSGFLAMWSGVATPEQAKRMVNEHFKNTKTFNAPYGVRTLSKQEKMYSVAASGNPSSWRGPIWGISNYLVFRSLVEYGYTAEAKELAAKTIVLFGRDLEHTGVLHENYLPDTGEPILNAGFQNWNYLVLNIIAWMEGRDTVREF